MEDELDFPLFELPQIIFEQLLNLMDPMSLSNLSVMSKKSNFAVELYIKRGIPMHLTLRAPDYLKLQSAAYPGEIFLWKFYKSQGSEEEENMKTVVVKGNLIKQSFTHQLEGPRVTYIHSLYFDRFEFTMKLWIENLLKIYGKPIDYVYLNLTPSYELGMNIMEWLKKMQGNFAEIIGVEGYGITMNNLRNHLEY